MSTTQEGPANRGGDRAPSSTPSFLLRILSSDLPGLAGREIGSTAGPTLIGRADECAVVLKDERISRRHACIEAEGNGFRLFDMGSANGIYVGNDRIVELRLSHGLRFRIGGTEFEFVTPRPPIPEPPPRPAGEDFT